jgi:hypothetical protein
MAGSVTEDRDSTVDTDSAGFSSYLIERVVLVQTRDAQILFIRRDCNHSRRPALRILHYVPYDCTKDRSLGYLLLHEGRFIGLLTTALRTPYLGIYDSLRIFYWVNYDCTKDLLLCYLRLH